MFRYSSRFWLYTPTILFVLIAVAVMAYWKVTADAFEKKLAAIKGRDAVPGIVLDWDGVTVGGFPFRIDADFTNFSIHGAGARGPFVWKARQFALHRLTYGRPTTVYEAAGPQHLEWSAADGAHSADFLPATLRGSSILGAHGLARFDADMMDAGGAGFTAQRLQFHMRRDPDGHSLDLMVKGDNVAAGGGHRNVQAYATLTNTAPLSSLLEGAAFWPDAVTAWHKSGGEIRIARGVNPDAAALILSALY